MAISASAAPKKKSDELNIRIGTYNVWSHSARQYQIKKGATNTKVKNLFISVSYLIVKSAVTGLWSEG